VVSPFAGIAGLSAPRALIPLALASALCTPADGVRGHLGTNLDAVVAVLGHVMGAWRDRRRRPHISGGVIVRRLKR